MRTCLAAAALLAPGLLAAHSSGPYEGHRSGRIGCQQFVADEFACHRIDLLAHLSVDTLDGGTVNDLWGWTDPLTGSEYVLVGTFGGTVFVDISNPESPVRIGLLPSHDELVCRSTGGCEEGSGWRDIKVYADHAYIVSEAVGHGMQVFDLQQLRDATPPAVFRETAWYSGFGPAHNLAINEQSGFAYGVGTDTYAGGPHFVDLADPARPRAAGGFPADSYTHDAQCVIYHGPDAEHAGAEICLLSNEDTLTIVDVSDKSSPALLSRTGYARAGYSHQGWLDDSQAWFYMNDEFDETTFGGRTTTYIWDVSDLDGPVLKRNHPGMVESIDHNNYVVGRYLYQSNYTSGLRILDLAVPDTPLEVAWFDSFPIDDLPTYDGSWSNYPFFASGVIAVSDMDYGLFLLQPMLETSAAATELETTVSALQQPDTTRLRFTYQATVTNNSTEPATDVVVTHVLDESVTALEVLGGGSCVRRARFADCALGALAPGATATLDLQLTASAAGQKFVEVVATSSNGDNNTLNNKIRSSLSLQSNTAIAPPSGGDGGGGGSISWLLLLVAALYPGRTAWVNKVPG